MDGFRLCGGILSHNDDRDGGEGPGAVDRQRSVGPPLSLEDVLDANSK